MPSRRTFLAGGAAIAAAGLARLSDSAPVEAAAPKGPSAFALAQAKHVQQIMPHARISNALAAKIAGDIDGYNEVAAEFRKAKLHNWDEPDFVFTAGPVVKQR